MTSSAEFSISQGKHTNQDLYSSSLLSGTISWEADSRSVFGSSRHPGLAHAQPLFTDANSSHRCESVYFKISIISCSAFELLSWQFFSYFFFRICYSDSLSEGQASDQATCSEATPGLPLNWYLSVITEIMQTFLLMRFWHPTSPYRHCKQLQMMVYFDKWGCFHIKTSQASTWSG